MSARKLWTAILWALIFAVSSIGAETRIRIDSVPATYQPTAGNEEPRPVSMEAYHFEVNPEMTRARIAIDYSYRGAPRFRKNGGKGPDSSYVDLQGLRYDADSHSIVYENAGEKTVCATVEEKKGLLGKRAEVTNTGACVLTAKVGDHTHDTGWTGEKQTTLDTFLEIRKQP